MIKINLLPVKASKKKETAKQQLLIFLVSLVVFLVAAAAAYSTQLVKIRSANNELEKSKKEIQRLKTIIGEMDNIKKLQDDVKKKAGCPQSVEKRENRSGHQAGQAERCHSRKTLVDQVFRKRW